MVFPLTVEYIRPQVELEPCTPPLLNCNHHWLYCTNTERVELRIRIGSWSQRRRIPHSSAQGFHKTRCETRLVESNACSIAFPSGFGLLETCATTCAQPHGHMKQILCVYDEPLTWSMKRMSSLWNLKTFEMVLAIFRTKRCNCWQPLHKLLQDWRCRKPRSKDERSGRRYSVYLFY